MNLTLTDLDPLAYILGYTYRDADYQNMMEQVDSMMGNILSATQAQLHLGFLGGTKCFRYELAKSRPYKGTRSKEKPEWLQHWQKPICDHLVAHWGAIVVDGIEADDAIGICWEAYRKEHCVTVASPDKDLRQLSGNFYDFKKCEPCFITEQEAAYNFWYSMLVGDTADNISGLPNCGPKNAQKILATFPAEFYSRAVEKAYHTAGKMHLFDEQYSLLKMLTQPAYGFQIPAPIPVPEVVPFAEQKVYQQPATVGFSSTNLLTSLGLD